ncbi:YlzJ-like family protein [Chengkuizengella axinellae]|uniref:YlzJ-like family protein n=1 Tax=Chengkuizengella axinellae TaxID=3064388 RepID=A0ABT9IVW9_9BACL|nr:YlzJ-like family protein [Chengkuizengella sp. 2205SS18-9]MDP5273501.1 YlzJ-like family protein [Chengkuizengella sp. 2205SS18-9]
MIMYSIVPLDDIIEGIENNEPSQEIELDGVIMQVQPMNSYQARIVRLISPNPQDYLNPAYSPGQTIYFHPHIET